MNPSQLVLAIVLLGILGGIAALFLLDRRAQSRRDATLGDEGQDSNG